MPQDTYLGIGFTRPSYKNIRLLICSRHKPDNKHKNKCKKPVNYLFLYCNED